jgi:hypothetical protein
MGLREASQGPAHIANAAENLGIVTLRKGTSILDEPFEAIAVSGRLEIGLGGLGLADQAEGLAEAEERVAVVRVWGQRRAIRVDGGPIALGQCQPPTESRQRGMIDRASVQETADCIHRTAVQRHPGTGGTRIGIGSG